MTLYTLYIKSGMLSIPTGVLETFMKLPGYDQVEIQGEHVTIKFSKLEPVQKAESEIRKMFYCYVIRESEFDKTGMTKARLVNITSFKESGKYYDNFNIEILPDTEDFNLVWAILNSHRDLPDHFIYHGYYTNNVPFIIPAHMKASDMKHYVKLGESK